MKNIITIDPGYSALGWAVGEKGSGWLEYGTLYFKEKDRLKEIHKKVTDLLREYLPIETVYIEDFRIYRDEIKDKHKTAFAIGVIVACAYELGLDVKLINHRKWKADFERIYWVVEPKLPRKWRDGLQKGSEHSRDAVMMLLPRVISLKSLLTGGKK